MADYTFSGLTAPVSGFTTSLLSVTGTILSSPLDASLTTTNGTVRVGTFVDTSPIPTTFTIGRRPAKGQVYPRYS
jgi:hypothetical protein